jgi:hypothetical protein
VDAKYIVASSEPEHAILKAGITPGDDILTDKLINSAVLNWSVKVMDCPADRVWLAEGLTAYSLLVEGPPLA